jgi:hypothetical protein
MLLIIIGILGLIFEVGWLINGGLDHFGIEGFALAALGFVVDVSLIGTGLKILRTQTPAPREYISGAVGVSPLIEWTGYIAGVEDAFKLQLLPGERIVVSPLEWYTPPMAMYYPGVPPAELLVNSRQLASQILVTNNALHLFGIQGDSITAHQRIGLGDVRSSLVKQMVRKNFARKSLGEDEAVVLLVLSIGGGEIMHESRYIQANDFCRDLESAVRRYSQQHPLNAPNTTVADELHALAGLVSNGVISRDDYERGKDLFLGRRPDARDKAISLLRSLHQLREAGAISESEYNSKKWDILSMPTLSQSGASSTGTSINEWYYQSDDAVVGPLTAAELRAKATQKEISADNFVRKGRSGKWVIAKDVRGLFLN